VMARGVARVLPVLLALFAVGCSAGAPTHRGGGRSRALSSVSSPRPGKWGVRTVLARPSVYTSFPQIAVSSGGKAIAAWVQGQPPKVYLGAARGAASSTLSSSQQVMADLGTITGGFREPVAVSAMTAGTPGNLTVAMSDPGTAYVAWGQAPAAQLWLAVLRDGRVSVPAAVIRKEAVPLAIFPLRGGRAALVWDQYGHGFPLLDYAVVDGSGRLGRVVTVAHLNGDDQLPTQISVNQAGVLAGAWTHGGGVTLRRSRPVPRNQARLILVVCEPFANCSTPTAIPLGRTRPACISPAVAVSADGTTHLVAAANDPAPQGCNRSLGVWATTGSRIRSRPRPALVSAAGDLPVITPDGPSSAIVVFNPGIAPHDTLAWSKLGPGIRAFTRPSVVADRDTINAPVLAASSTGRFLIAWTHASSHHNPKLSINAAIGHGQRLGAVSKVIPAQNNPNTFTAAIDAAGDALMIWNQTRETTTGSGNFGIFAKIYRHAHS
jgi:hypothetical protein